MIGQHTASIMHHRIGLQRAVVGETRTLPIRCSKANIQGRLLAARLLLNIRERPLWLMRCDKE